MSDSNESSGHTYKGIKIYLIVEKISAYFSDLCCVFCSLSRGGHHLTYLATFESGVKRVVRISYPFLREHGSGIVPLGKMKSEVATIKYVRDHTNIPVPDVLLHDEDKDGRVGAEWMVLEYIEGASITDVWTELTDETRYAVARAIADIWSELLSLRFDRIGSLYQNEDGRIDVGPMTFLPSNNRRDTAPPDPAKCGPFSSVKEWLIALAAGDLGFEKADNPETREEEQRKRDVIADLSANIVYDDPSVRDLCAISLEHVDLTIGNVIVDREDPTKILGVIDWEGARTVPLFAIQPRWYLPLDALHLCPEEEIPKLQTYTRKAIRDSVPEWYAATEDPGHDLRELFHNAKHSKWDPAILDFEQGDVYIRGLM